MDTAKKNIIVRTIWQADKKYKEFLRASENEDKQGIKDSFTKRLLKDIEEKILLIKQKFPQGVPIAKNKIPKALRAYGIENLFHIGLRKNWRMLYSFMRGKDLNEVLCLVAIIADHDEYNKIMGYK